MKSLKQMLAVMLVLPWLLVANVSADDVSRAVYHVDFEDPDRYSATLTSINNMLNAYENDLAEYDVSIVFVGLGVRFITDDPRAGETARLTERRSELKGRLNALQSIREVKLVACNNTVEEFGLTDKELYDGVEVVPSGVVQLAKLQKEGAAYIKIQ